MSIRRSIRVLFMALLVAIVCGLPSRATEAVGTGGISGTVTDGDGDPLAGATVLACPSPYETCRVGTTGADGKYVILNLAPDSSYTVEAWAEWHAHRWYDGLWSPYNPTPVEVIEGQTTPNINFQLGDAGAISGEVTDEGGGPIQGAWVTAVSDGAGIGSGFTSSDGSYEIAANLAVGSYEVSARADGYITKNYAIPVGVLAGEDTPDINFQLDDATGSISGTVTDAEGDGIVGAEVCATVHILPWGYLIQCAETGPDGSYSVDVFYTEEYHVCASAAGYAFTCYGGAHDPTHATLVSVVLGQDTPNIDISLDEEGTISGIVTRASDGQPIEGAFIIAIPEGDGYYGFGHSEADGVYTITGLAAGSYVLRSETEGYVQVFYDDAFDRDSATVVLVTEGENTPDIDFALLVSGAVSGRVTDTNGTPLEGVYVDACLVPGYEVCDGVGTDSDGRYEIDGLLPGDYVVGAWHEDYISEYYNDKRSEGEADLVSVVAGQTTENIDFALGVLGSISGKVTDTGGTPIQGVGVEICLDPDCDPQWSGTTDADGNYRIQGLTSGSYVVWTNSDGYADEYYNDKLSQGDADRVNVVEGQPTENINFALGPPGNISGTVWNTGGTPIEGAEVEACPEDAAGDCGDAVSGADGTYTITGLDYFRYIVRAEADGYVREYWQDVRRRADATPVPVSEGNLNQTGIDFHLDVGGTISGTVTAGGNPVEGATVTAFAPSDPWGTFLMAVTDADGDYVIASVGAGSYLVWAIQEGYAWEYYHEVRWEEDATAVPVTDGQETENINFTLDVGSSICGTVRDKDGNPIAGADVYANPQNHEEPWWWWIFQGFMGSDFMDSSELDGTYAIGHLGAGSYVVRASAAGYDDKYYNAVAEREDADPVPVTEGYSSCSIDFVFGSDEPVPGPTLTPTPTPTATATPATRTPTPKPTKTRTPKPTATRTPGPTTTPVLVLPTATPLPPLPPPPYSGAAPILVAPPTGSGPAGGGFPWPLATWLLAGTAGAAVVAGWFLRLAKSTRR